MAHQFSKIGKHAMVGGGSKINKDIPPFILCGRDPITFAGINIVGLRRRGFTSDQIRNIKDIYDIIYSHAQGLKSVSLSPRSVTRFSISSEIPRGALSGATAAPVPKENLNSACPAYYGVFTAGSIFCRPFPRSDFEKGR